MCKNFGERLRKLRKKKGLTLKELAQNFDCCKSSFSNYENGKNHPPVNVLVDIADFFGVSVDYILGRSKIKNIEKFLLEYDSIVEILENGKLDSKTINMIIKILSNISNN